MLLDIEMFKLKGLVFLRILVDFFLVIIIIVFWEFVLDGYELEVIDYLVKFIVFECFVKVINCYKK